MTLLLDTHAFIWAAVSPERLPDATRQRVVDGTTTVLVSAVTSWEIAIKRAMGSIQFRPTVAEVVEALAFTPLPITIEHAAAVEDLPPLHRDPFDRLLVAQARLEGATLVTGDARIRAYDVASRWG